jgi:site-specific DNA recombinase
MLINRIYYGEYYWKGELYKGTHEPLISRELFDNVQKMLDRRSSCPTGRHKHDFAFQGKLVCGHCGCAVVGEVQKQKYVYYHCSGNRGKCPEKYAREELIDRQFADSLSVLQLDDDVLGWIVSVMKAKNDEKRHKDTKAVTLLKARRQELQDQIDTMYSDRLTGVLTTEDYLRLSEKVKIEMSSLENRMAQLENGKTEYLEDKIRAFELAQKAASLYSTQNESEKRKLLNFVCSNSSWKDGILSPNYRKPFDLLAVTNTAFKDKKATFTGKSDLFDIWRPLPDLNRCRRRERAVSWAGLDEGDFETIDSTIYYTLKG